MLLRSVETILLHAENAQRGMRAGEAGIQLDRLFQQACGFIEPVGVQEKITQIKLCFGFAEWCALSERIELKTLFEGNGLPRILVGFYVLTEFVIENRKFPMKSLLEGVADFSPAGEQVQIVEELCAAFP